MSQTLNSERIVMNSSFRNGYRAILQYTSMRAIEEDHLPSSWTVSENSSEYIRYSSGSDEIMLINGDGKEYDIRVERDENLLFRENGFDNDNTASEVIFGVMKTLNSV